MVLWFAYQMNAVPGYFQHQDIAKLRTQTFVQRIEYHPTLTSTNDVGVELAMLPDLDLPLLVLTDEQTRGRGRGENQWWSSCGALTFSLVVSADRLVASTNHWPRISLTTGLAVCDALQRLVPKLDFGIKWPNDVFVRDQKVCGILIETPPKASDRLVIGCGVNVNNSFADAPLGLRQTATSLFDEVELTMDLAEVLIKILSMIELRFRSLKEDPMQLVDELRAKCILTDRNVTFEVGGEQFQGTCLGMADDGALILENQSGRRQFHAGSILAIS